MSDFIGRALFLIALAVTAGCGGPPPDETSILKFGEGDSEFSATVDVPEGEAASIGNYRASVTYPDGRVFEVSGVRDGSISGNWLIDLGGNEYPELIVWMTSAGSGSYASVHIYWMTDEGLQFEDASALPEPLKEGYQGHDSLSVSDFRLRRCFPRYREGDPNARPSGSERCLVYNSMMGWVRE
jgi:hypothetical protein